MQCKQYIFFWSLIFVWFGNYAQDKVFLRDGKMIICKIVAISEKTISYKDTVATAPLITISKSEVLLTEYESGKIFMFSKEVAAESNSSAQSPGFTTIPELNETREQRKVRKMNEWKNEEALLPNGILGIYIPELVFGRLTVSYERLFAGKSMGIKIPVSLTYDGMGALGELSSNSSSSNTNTYSTGSNTNTSNSPNNSNTSNPPIKRNRGTGFITGVDVNYYHDLKPKLKYFFGPRIRYGTDMTLGGIEGLTFQLQNGIFKSSGKKMTSTLGFGVGFFKFSSKYANSARFDPKQFYPWASFTWRLGFRL